MLSLYQTLSLRYLAQRWFRAVLIVACIALGVSTLVATRALNETMARAARSATNPVSGLADLIVSFGDLSIPASLADELDDVEGVQAARPCVFANVTLPDLDNRSVLLMGLDFSKFEDLVKQFKAGGDANGEVIVTPKTIAEYATVSLLPFGSPVIAGKGLEDRLPTETRTIRVQKTPKAPKISSLIRVGDGLEANGAAAALGGEVLITDITHAANIVNLAAGQVNRIDLALKPGSDIKQTMERVKEVLRGRAQVRTPYEQNQSIDNVLGGMQTAFSLSGIAALVVGLFLVYNALSISVAERRTEIGVLMSLGATRSQIRWLFAGEAALLGLAGSGLGIPIGIGLAYIGLQPVQEILSEVFFRLNAAQVDISAEMIATAIAAGLLTAITAALVPAIRASRESPADAVSRVVRMPSWRYQAVQVSASVLLIIVGFSLILVRDLVHKNIGVYGGLVLVLFGALLATPLIAALGARILQPLVRRFLGVEWRLAGDNLVRAPGRTGLVIAALAAGVALVMETAGTILSNRVAFDDWIQNSMTSDLIVTSGSPVGAGGGSLTMEEELGHEIARLPFVQAVMPVSFLKIDYGAAPVFVVTVDAPMARGIELQSNHHTMEWFRRLNEPNSALISENFAKLHGVDVGSTLHLGNVDFTVIGKIVDYSWNNGAVYINRGDSLRHWPDPKVHVFDVYLKPDADLLAAKKEVFDKFGVQHALYVFTRSELQTRINGLIEQLYGVAYAQQLVVMIVAALGVVTALLISVLQRRREMGLLRAIGASQMQVIRSVLAEACLMGVIGTVIGVIVGIPIQWYCLQVVVFEETGFLFPLHVPWFGALIIAAGAMLTATAAGLGPAIYAVRERIPDAIAYE